MPQAIRASNAQVTVTSTATRLTAGACEQVVLTSDDGAATNGNTAVIWVGGSSVAVNNGVPLRPGSSVTFDLDDSGDIWVYTAGASQKLSFVALV